ncbi:Mechanosensitive ion channel-domain-containing protein [Elsinoe ampelina]|uniref:Mechanosensitive ion channel protein n=1 Tax=Elsinoe ampelina TaxID=302913 RepID=A0A6A6GIR8_9PEZI|nr:Mechanosensitive ion channel-domain-containing protein [Elsinoe ampelina]
MAGRGDATVNIPLAPVHSNGGYTRSDSITPLRSKEAASEPPSASKRHFGHRVRRAADSGDKVIGYDGEEDTLNRVGRFYKRVLEFSIITRYFIYVLPLALLIAIPIIVGATAVPNARIGSVPIVWFFTWVEVLWLSLWVSKIVAHFLPSAFQILAGVVSSGTRKYALVIRAVQIPLSLVGWAVTSLATFIPLMTRNPDARARNDTTPKNWMNIVQNILGACVAASLVLLVEKTFIQLISINYHRKQFNARIKDSKRNLHILGLLYDASRNLFPMYCNEFAEEDYIIADQLNLHKLLGGSGTKTHARSGSATPMRFLQDVGRIGDKVTSVFGNVAQEITGKQVFNPNSAHSIVVEALEKKGPSEALARRLWMSFVIEGKDSLYMEDVVDVLGQDHREEAEEAFMALDRDGNGDISLDEMILTVVEFGRERKSIATSMHDVDQAITVLDGLLLTVVAVATVLIFIAFLNRNFVTTLATAGTALLSLSFVFAGTAQEVLGSCIFLFSKHPFDIGDVVEITKEQLIVDHISLLYTVFRRIRGENVGRLVQIPNIVLNGLWIENVTRSKAMKEQISLMISYDTTFEDIQLLKQELINFVSDKENSRDYMPELDVEVLGTSDLSKLELRVEIQHKSNWSNETLRATRRSKFMCALIAALRRVPIYGPGGGGDPLGSAANASYSVAISAEHAQSNKEQASKDKNEARMVPKRDSNEEDDTLLRKRSSRSTGRNNALGLSNAQANAIDELHNRSPANDMVRDEVWSGDRDESTTTVGDRPNIDKRDEENIKGLLRRESTRGRRKANSSEISNQQIGQAMGSPQYAQQSGVADYAQSQYYPQPGNSARPPLATINSLRSTYTTTPSTPQGGAAAPSYDPNAPLPLAPGQAPGQIKRSPSNPYRQQQPPPQQGSGTSPPSRKPAPGQSGPTYRRGSYEDV